MCFKLYKIAEKIRYEKIGSDKFKGIKKNLSNNFEIYKKPKKQLKIFLKNT